MTKPADQKVGALRRKPSGGGLSNKNMKNKRIPRTRLIRRKTDHFFRLKPKSAQFLPECRMKTRGKRIPIRKICPRSRIIILAHGQFLKGIMAADKPITIHPANSATSVSLEGCQRKSFETIGVIIDFLLWMDLVRCNYLRKLLLFHILHPALAVDIINQVSQEFISKGVKFDIKDTVLIQTRKQRLFHLKQAECLRGQKIE